MDSVKAVPAGFFERFPHQRDAVQGIRQPVENGIGQRWVIQPGVPCFIGNWLVMMVERALTRCAASLTGAIDTPFCGNRHAVFCRRSYHGIFAEI